MALLYTLKNLQYMQAQVFCGNLEKFSLKKNSFAQKKKSRKKL